MSEEKKQARIFYQQDCDMSLLEGKKIAVIGYGSQGHAHALNLKDSGLDVVVGLYEGSKSWKKAESQGLKVYPVAEAAKMADVIMILIPDELQADVYKSEIAPNLKAGDMLMFAHGFNINYKLIIPPKHVEVTMIAPNAPGHTVRSEYQELLSRMLQARLLIMLWLTATLLAELVQDFLRPHSRLRQRQTSLVSRQSFAAVL